MKKKFLTFILTIATMLMCIFGLSACGDKEISFKLNFVVDDKIYATIDTSGDEVIALPENPTKENHSFDGWYWDKDTWQTPFTANSLLDAPLSSDMSVYAKFSLNTINGVTFEDVETTYNGAEKTIAVSNLPDGASVVYDKANTYINAGEYTVTATVSQENYEDLHLTATLKINKAIYDMSAVVFADKTVTYNGDSHSITATNLPNGVTVEYTGNNQTNADEYTITATFTGDSANYEPIADKTATLTINKAIVSKPAQDSTSFVYNGNEQTYLLAENSLYTISGNKQTNAGSYIVTVSLNDKNNYQWNDETATDLSYSFNIAKAVYDMSAVVFADKTVAYNGESHSITATNLPDGVTAQYTGNNQTNADEYTVTATFTGDSANYEPIADKTATLTINKASVSKPAQDSTSFVYNGNEQTYLLAENSLYTISGNKQTNAGNHTVTVSLTDKNNYQWNDETDNDLSYSFNIAKAIYDMSAVVFADKTVTYNGESHSIEVMNLPNGVTVSYENNEQTNADSYTVVAKFTDTTGNYENPVNKTAILRINKATYDMSGVVFADKTVTYNGNAYSIEAQNIPNGLSVIYDGNDKTNADTYTVTATFTDTTGNFNNPENMTAKLIINKATITGITLTDKTFTYDTKTHALAVDGTLPACVNVTYENNDKVNANTYTVTASFEDTSGNYIVPKNMSAKLVIEKATVSGITFKNKTFTYNGTKRSLEISGTLPEEVTVSYVNNGKTNANTYNVTATFACETENYVVPEDMTAVLTIKKAMYDMSAVTFENKTVTYDGKIHSLAVSDNLPDGVSVTYENNDKISANQYIVNAIFTGDSINYYAIDDMQAMLTINKATYDMSKVQFVGSRFTYDGTQKFIYVIGELPDGVTVNYTNNGKINANTYTVTATFTGDTENYNKLSDWTASLIIDKATYDMSGISFKNQTFTYDTTAKDALIMGTLPNGVEVSYVGNGKTDVGTYSVTAKFNGDSNNYHLIEDMTATLKINQAVPYIKEVGCKQTLNIYSTVELIADTEVAGTISLDNGQTLTLGYKTYSWTFVPEDTHNYTNATGTVGLTVCALVSYYNDGVLFSNQNIVLNNSATVPTGTPLKADASGYRYTFSHWSLEENGAEYNFTNAITADLNLYAVYNSEEIVYAINYYNTKGVEHDNILTYTVSTQYTLIDIEKEHYVFNGWMDKDGNEVTKINKGTFGVLDLYATWTPIEYAITYDLGYRGAVNGNNATTYNVEDTFSFEDATYDEYHTFAGWYLEENFVNQKASVSVGESGAITLYAKWNFSGTYISTVSELQKMVYNMAGVYELKNDIDLTNETWTAIGDSTNPFTGYFNGADYTLTNPSLPIIAVNEGQIFYLNTTGLLCETNNNIISMCKTGGGVAKINTGTIQNSSSVGYVEYSYYSGIIKNQQGTKQTDQYKYSYLGGIAAYNSGNIEKCVVRCDIEQTFSNDNKLLGTLNGYAGGIAGYSSGKIENCYYVGNIDVDCDNNSYFTDWTYSGYTYSKLYCGGIAGIAQEIMNCYADGDISGYAWARSWKQQTNSVSPRDGYPDCYVGGIAGRPFFDGFTSGIIANSFTSAASISSSAWFGENQWGDIGTIDSLSPLNDNCYYNANCVLSGVLNPSRIFRGGTSCNIVNFTSRTWILNNLGWDETIWYLQDGQYPKLWFEVK